jgi:glycosyltransferase involved in cell wall biosynthesis
VTDLSVRFYTKYDRKGASSRYRSFQYFEALREEGIRCQARPLLDDAYLEHVYETGRRPWLASLRAYLSRLVDLRSADDHDLVVVEKELFPYLPAGLERRLASLEVPYVLDFDDAIFHNYDRADLAPVRWLLADKIPRLMREAATVVCGNRYLQRRAREAGASSTEILRTVIDLDRYPFPTEPSSETFTIGWIGSPTTVSYLEAVRPALAELTGDADTRLRLIGAGDLALDGVDAEHLEWSRDTEIEHLREIDVGIMPLPDTPWERGKCGLKLIQYMALGRPVVASPVGANRAIVDDGDAGFLARGPGEWVQALERLREDPKLREAMGRRGREVVEERFSLQARAPELASLLREAAGPRQ